MIITSQKCNLRDIVKIGSILELDEFKSHGFSVDETTVKFSVSGNINRLRSLFKLKKVKASIQK